MSALRAGNWRRLLQGAGAIVFALAANLAWAGDPSPDQIAPRNHAASPPTSASQEEAAPRNPPAIYDPTAGPTLSPVQKALRAALERLVTRADRVNPLGSGDWRGARGAIAAFYAERFYTPIWVGEGGLTEIGQSALSQLERAREDGLDLSAFALPPQTGAGLAPDQVADTETAIASAVVTYAQQATGSRVRPSRVSPFAYARPSLADPGAALAEVAAADDPAARLAGFNPPQKGYRDLREALRRLTERVRDGEPDVSAISADFDPETGAEQAAGALRRAKRRAGAPVRTASLAFGAPLARRKAAILANMEMWRWEPRDMGEERIEVNIPDFSVEALRGDEVVLKTRAIVGKPETPTPIFSADMRYVLINPSWRVPDSIIKKEFASRLGALSRRGYEVKAVGGRVTVRQLPGDDNALGRIAFMFPNDHAIYLHDTPARELFDEDIRAFSHGCVRVEDPLSLAEFVLGGEKSGWTAGRIEAAFGDKERTVFLLRALPVHIEYFTEFVDEFGELQERPDVYGLSCRVANILARPSQD